MERDASFVLPDGSFVCVETHEGGVRANEDDRRHWRSLDLTLKRPDGQSQMLCSVDHEDQKGLRVLVFGQDGSEPIYEQLVTLTEK